MAEFGYVLGLLLVTLTELSAQEALITGFQSSVVKNGSLYTYQGTVDQLSKQTTIVPVITHFNTGVTITSLTSDPENDVLFFYEYFTQTIYQISDFTSLNVYQASPVHAVSSSLNTNIAFDWITRNLYCTDGILGWILVIHMGATREVDMVRILLDTNMESPGAITVDPKEGYMFWSDIYKGSPRIERAYLSGERREVIVSTSLLIIGDVSADVQERRIYWTDRMRNTIESCMYDGQQREIIHRRNNYVFSDIMTDLAHVCVTEEYQNILLCMYKSSAEYVLLERYDRQPYGLEVFDKSRKPSSTDKCAPKSCQHFCAPTPAGATCLCKNGYTLQGDEKSCIADHDLPVKGLLLGNSTHVCVIDFLNLESLPFKAPTCFIDNLQDTIFLSVDVTSMDLFFADKRTRSLNSINIQTRIRKQLVNTGIVSGLGYDWVGQNLYWTEADTRKVKLVSVSVATPMSIDLVLSTLSPSDVTIDPHGRMIYWISGLGTPQNTIQGMSTDGGTGQTTIVSSGNELTALFYDTMGNRLFWVEGGTLKSSLGSGSDITTLKALATQQHSQLIIYKMYAVWISFTSSQIHTMSMVTKQLLTRAIDGFGDVTGMAVFDETIQSQQPEPCSVLNGGCSHICIPTSNTGRRCVCTFGFTLQLDKKFCKSKPPLTNNFLLVPDLNHARLYQLSLDNVTPQFLALDLQVDRPVDAVYDPVNLYMYWTEANLKVIKRSKLDGTEVQTLLTFSQEYPERLAIDFSTGNLFYTTSVVGDSASRDGKVGVLRIIQDQTFNKVLIKDEGAADFIQGLLVFPKNGLLIWSGTDFDGPKSVGAIHKSFMDGSAITLLVSDVNSPQGLTMDYETGRVYWASGDGVEYSDLSGNKGTLVKSSEMLTDLVVTSNVIYYTGRNTRKVIKIDKSTGANIHWLDNTPEVGSVFSIDIYNGQQQPANAACTNNGLCDVFCLPTLTGKTCGCQDGVYLQQDKRTCGSTVTCDTTIPNGLISSFCTGIVAETCTYQCNSGYHKNVDHSTITCLSVGAWTTLQTSLCLADSPPSAVSIIPVIAGAVGAVIVIFILIVIVVCLWKRKRKPQTFQESMYMSNMSRPTVVQNQYGMPQDINISGAIGPQVVVTPPDYGYKDKINPAYLYPPEQRARCPSPDHVYAELPPAYSQTDPNYIHPMENEHDEAQPNPYVDPEPVAEHSAFRQSQQERKNRSFTVNTPPSNVHQASKPVQLDNDGTSQEIPYLMPFHEPERKVRDKRDQLGPDVTIGQSLGSSPPHRQSQQGSVPISSRRIYTGCSQQESYDTTGADSATNQQSQPGLFSNSQPNAYTSNSYSPYRMPQYNSRRSSQQEDPYHSQTGINTSPSNQLYGHDYIELGR
ncbi:low-density lipoprotein receptor-related protein 4-like isoform X1 [Mizuhopecten yessoensis]|uniref:low-density lipoprotein receptor-related protein 4-like isoform X1 n=1 Tax=Mizuhopecten yessoensis TaxID=6573 RepID=UPI000B45BE41|nr:low-density lipoprotein receptor-related protein 4-like isoform X1 [Mizuhopecten yessoensis]